MGTARREVRKRMEDDVAGCVRGWSVREGQSGMSSLRARGSITAPERICEPRIYELRVFGRHSWTTSRRTTQAPEFYE